MSADDLREELRELTVALRATMEWHAATGAAAVPRVTDELARERAAELDALAAQPLADDELAASEQQPVHADAPAHPKPTEPTPAQPRPDPARHTTKSEPERTAPPPSREAAAVEPPKPVPERPAPKKPTAKPLGDGERARRLSVLAERVSGCMQCGLHEARTQTVFARGTGSSGVCFVGEGPGADEDRQGEPFVGKAGQLLDRMIAAMGLERDAVYVCNIVKCRPPKNRKPEPEEMAACVPYLHEQLELLAPKVIVALGATAVQGLLGTSQGITRMRGNWRLYKGEVAVMPTFHPAYLLRTPKAKRDVWNDLQEVMKVAGLEPPTREG